MKHLPQIREFNPDEIVKGDKVHVSGDRADVSPLGLLGKTSFVALDGKAGTADKDFDGAPMEDQFPHHEVTHDKAITPEL